jgi:lipid-binding SYLF domain-containing protein
MQRRDFIRTTGVSLALGSLALAGCTTVASTTATRAENNDKRRITDSDAEATLGRLYSTVQGSRELVGKALGVLVFPNVLAAGLGIGGQYGEGILRAGGKTVDHYSIASLSVGLQAGAQSKAIILLFMTNEALDKFRRSEGWAAGVDASVAVAKVGANGVLDATAATGPVMAFVLTNAGLMANLTLEGTKITRLKS